MRRMDAPPIVRKYIKNAQNEYQECGGPLGFEADSNHAAST